VLILLGLFSTAYLLAIVPRSAQDMAYDRYLIPVMPVVLIPILWAWQRQRRGVAVGGWIVLALFSGYAIATTHDHFASARARLRAATELRSAGVARQQITAGFEYDGWTELEISGHINDDRVRVPALAYQPVDREKAYGHLAFGYYFWPRTPSIDPRYFVVYSPQPGLVPAGRPPVHYRAWLPPFHRTVLMQRLPEAAPLASKAAP
jgi:hypothetical protein